MKIDEIFNPIALDLERAREWNLEKYHMYSMILEALVYSKRNLNIEEVSVSNIEKMFRTQGLPEEDSKFDAKVNAALVQLFWMNLINYDLQSVSITLLGEQAYNEQRFHEIAASLYNAEQTKKLSKIAIIIASVLSGISIVTTIIIACLQSKGCC